MVKSKKAEPAAAQIAVAVHVTAVAIFDRFKQIVDLKPIPITCKGWGQVYVKPMSAAQTESLNELDSDPKKQMLAKSVMCVMCDADGRPVFDVGNAEHLALVQAQPQGYLVDFLSQAYRALGTGEEGAADAKKG